MKIIAVIVTLIATFSLTGCNTMAGFGKDIQQGGEVIERTAQ